MLCSVLVLLVLVVLVRSGLSVLVLVVLVLAVLVLAVLAVVVLAVVVLVAASRTRSIAGTAFPMTFASERRRRLERGDTVEVCPPRRCHGPFAVCSRWRAAYVTRQVFRSSRGGNQVTMHKQR